MIKKFCFEENLSENIEKKERKNLLICDCLNNISSALFCLKEGLKKEKALRIQQLEYYHQEIIHKYSENDEWEKTEYSLGKLCEIHSGGINTKKCSAHEGIPILTISTSNIEDNLIYKYERKLFDWDLEFDKHISKKSSWINPGDLCIGKTINKNNSNAKIALNLNKYACLYNQFLFKITVLDKKILDNRYLYFLLLSYAKWNIKKCICFSSWISLRKRPLQDLKLRIPSIQTQTEISDFLQNFLYLIKGLYEELIKVEKLFDFYRTGR